MSRHEMCLLIVLVALGKGAREELPAFSDVGSIFFSQMEKTLLKTASDFCSCGLTLSTS